MKSVNVTSLEARTNAVVQQTTELKAAIADEQEQRAALLSVVLTMIKPALPSLLSKIQIDSVHHNDGQHQDQAKYHARRGLRLDGCGSKTGPVYDEGDRGGAIEGWDVFLLDDGSVLELHYAGSWSAYDRDTDVWTVEQERTLPADDAVGFLVGEGHDKAALEAISVALDKQVDGKAKSRIKAARERADTIRAILTLLS